MEIFRPNTEFHKYGRKNSISTFVRILITSALISEPILDFPENAKMDGSNAEKRMVRTGKNSIRFQHYNMHMGLGTAQDNAQAPTRTRITSVLV
jgi:hypothetical protein